MSSFLSMKIGAKEWCIGAAGIACNVCERARHCLLGSCFMWQGHSPMFRPSFLSHVADQLDTHVDAAWYCSPEALLRQGGASVPKSINLLLRYSAPANHHLVSSRAFFPASYSRIRVACRRPFVLDIASMLISEVDSVSSVTCVLRVAGAANHLSNLSIL
jgi:hypothetical protein